LVWTQKAEAPAPPAFQQLYVANLEPRLLGTPDERAAAQQALVRLHRCPAWTDNLWLGRAILLGYWLDQQGAELAGWASEGTLSSSLLGIVLGQLALLNESLSPALLGVALTGWQLSRQPISLDLLKLRLTSLTSALGSEPLAYGLAQVGESAKRMQPWRCAHRGLRIALPQPDLRPSLTAPLADMLLVADVATTPAAQSAAPHEQKGENDSWQLILEFGHSRSEFFDQVLTRCQRLPGFAQLMDEDRTMVYRVTFTRSELRRFWQIWDYVQGWSSVKVYVNGNELEKWKVWPYSQYMR
jgi:hypothetical protein